MIETKLYSIMLDAALAFELEGDYHRVFKLAASRESGQRKRDLTVMSSASKEQINNLIDVLLKEEEDA